METFQISAIDPLLFRDARPFSDVPGAQSARTLRLPMPSTFAGFVRTLSGKALGWQWDTQAIHRALNITVHGPLLQRNEEIVFRAPADALIYAEEDSQSAGAASGKWSAHQREATYSLARLTPRPSQEPGGCDLPPGERAVCPPIAEKPVRGFSYWPAATMYRWLAAEQGGAVPELGVPPIETRVHAAIDADSGRAADHMLFATEMVALSDVLDRDAPSHPPVQWTLLARTDSPALLEGSGFLGGERRVVSVAQAHGAWPDAPDFLRAALRGSHYLRMLLATPAIFSHGSRPGWLQHGQGAPPGAESLALKLVGAAVPKHEAVSGWSYRTDQPGIRGPKPVKWAAPAGAIYFFEVVSGNAADVLDDIWLQSVSDDPQDRRDGFGLALWGIWNPEEVPHD